MPKIARTKLLASHIKYTLLAVASVSPYIAFAHFSTLAIKVAK